MYTLLKLLTNPFTKDISLNVSDKVSREMGLGST